MALLLPTPIETSRLRMRPLQSADARALNKFASLKSNLTYLSYPPHQSLEDTQQFIAASHTAWQEGSKFNMAVEWKETGELCGTFAVIDEGVKAYFGYAIFPAHTGKGIATEACQWAIGWLQNQRTISRIYAFCDSKHEASKSVLRKAGLTEEATLQNWFYFPNQFPHVHDCTFFVWQPPS